MGIRDKADPALRRALDGLGPGESADVLVHPAGRMDGLVAYLTARRDDDGDLAFNVLGLAGCVVLRATRDVIDQVADRDDVARVTGNPTFTAGGAAPPPRSPKGRA